MRFRSLLLSLALVVPLTAAAQVRWPDGIGHYVGIDARLTFPSGGYSGLFNLFSSVDGWSVERI